MITEKIYTGNYDTTDKNPELTLFFSGWGMDKYPFLKFCTGQRDIIICYDYRSLDFDPEILNFYSAIYVIGWSMGVWVASSIFNNKKNIIRKAIALNGTMYPVDDTKGIPKHIFNGTLNGLDERKLYKFQRRMCGSSELLNKYLLKAPKREVPELKEELHTIAELYKKFPESNFKWDQVYICNSDKIFPVQSQLNAWENENSIIINGEHYPEEHIWKMLFDIN